MSGNLPDSAVERNEYPLADGLLYYFPAALAAVARVSKIGNDQHNPGEPMHWARGKSTDHANKILRHQLDAGTLDSDGTRHSAKVAWRALAQLQEELEREEGAPLPRNARLPSPAAQSEAKIAYDVACDKPVCTQSEWDETRLGAALVGLKLPEQSPRTSDYTPTRLPKRDPRWAEQSTESARRDLRDYGSVFYRHSMQDGKLVVEHIPLETVYVTQHPMAAETIRDHDERLAGGEDRL